MGKSVVYSTPQDVMAPIGPYNHISISGNFIWIGAVAGVNPFTGQLVDSGIAGQTTQIIGSFDTMLRSVEASLDNILHINVFLKDMADFAAMNAAYEEAMDGRKPPRTAKPDIKAWRDRCYLIVQPSARLVCNAQTSSASVIISIMTGPL